MSDYKDYLEELFYTLDKKNQGYGKFKELKRPKMALFLDLEPF